MANLQEKPVWESGIYQLETSDPVLGGPDGIDNLQGKQLANRTGYLKSQVDDLLSGTQAVACAARLTAPRVLGMTGDGSWSVSFDGSRSASGALTLADSGVAAGSYGMVTVDAKGRVTGGRQMAAADLPALDWSKIVSGKPSSLAGYGIADAAFKDAAGRVWGAAFRAEKGDPSDGGEDVASVGFAFGVDGDTGLFAAKSVEPGRGSSRLMLKIDGDEQCAISSGGAIYARQYGWLHERFAAKAATLAGYGIGDAASKSDLQAAVSLLADGVPEALNTLKKLAGALGGDSDYANTANRKLAGKLDAVAFDGAIGPRGYQKRPGGLVEQWFSVGFSRRDEQVPFTFPTAMAEVHGVWVTALDAEGEVTAVLSAQPSQTGGQLRVRGIYGGPPDAGVVYVRAIGKL
ncbi:hypothetical protein [Chromobacterium subtsugae]|uniref:hypothetical protein n=1 Tax=Chromobacterium subtsugae TaxID=251747 RepID=UPI000640E2C0|nr:hypothetical protein [Chromobacterium subtsugae]